MNRQEDFNPEVTHGSDGWVSLRVWWRKPLPSGLKSNLLWWLKNDWDPDPPAWFMPGSSDKWRRLNWWTRNPAENFKRWVLGVGDQNYTVSVYGNSQWTTDNLTDDMWEVAIVDGMLPFVSVSTTKLGAFYAGWQPVGVAALKFSGWFIVLFPLLLVLFPLMVALRLVHAKVRS